MTFPTCQFIITASIRVNMSFQYPTSQEGHEFPHPHILESMPEFARQRFLEVAGREVTWLGVVRCSSPSGDHVLTCIAASLFDRSLMIVQEVRTVLNMSNGASDGTLTLTHTSIT